MSGPEDHHPQASPHRRSARFRQHLARVRRWRIWHRARRTLPMDSDVEITRSIAGVPVPGRLRLSFVAWAALGGAAGTLLRWLLTQASPSWESLAAGTIVVNILGPFMLGVLLNTLSWGDETPRNRTLRLLVGTGFLGALTSYAQLAVDTVTVAEEGHILLALAYAAATIIAGVGATWAGIYASSRWRALAHSRKLEATSP